MGDTTCQLVCSTKGSSSKNLQGQIRILACENQTCELVRAMLRIMHITQQPKAQKLDMEKISRMASENGVVIFSKSTCCLCYVVDILFQELAVRPVVYEIDKDPEGREMEKALLRLRCNAPAVPAVFIGGKLVGSTNEVMSLHISGLLVTLLKPYQAVSS